MKNKQQKISKFHAQLLESYCDACFTSFKKVPAKKIDEGLQILVCTKCKCKTHKCCYDLQANSTFVTERIRQFICSKCQKNQKLNNECFICHQSDGVMTISQDGQTLHIFCALYHNQIQIVSYTPKIRVKKSITYNSKNDNCDICKKPNAFQFCAFQNCKKTAHPYCVKKLYIKEQQENQQPKCWNHHLTCVNNNIFDLSDQIIPYSLFQETVQQELKQIQHSTTIKIENKQKIMKQKYQEYFQQAIQKKKNSKKIKRGGYSFVSCPEHQYTPYCICQGIGQGDMIQCECCFTWYHMSCIKYSGKSQQQFSCSFCKSFYDLKKKIVEEVINGKSDVYEIKADLPVKMSFMDVMWIIRAIDSRISKGNIAKMLKQLIKYPLRTSKIEKLIKIQNKNKLEVLCEEFYLQYFFSDEQLKCFKPYPVLGLDSGSKPIKIQENIQKNKKLRNLIVEVRNFCKRQGIVDEFKGILNQLDFKQNALSDSYEKIIELSKSQQKYQEIPILKIKAQAYSFLQIVKKVNSGSIITISQLQQAVQKANLIENVPEYLIQPLIEKYQKIKQNLKKLISIIQNDPYNLNQIKQICSKLTNQFKIEPPIFYELYIEERNFINFLYLFHAKQIGKQIQGEIHLKQKIEDLVSQTADENFQCNQEIVKALNNIFQIRQKSNQNKYFFPKMQEIIQNLQKKTIKLQFKNIQNKSFKVQKLEYLFSKIKFYQIQDSRITFLNEKYEHIKNLYHQVVELSLLNVTEKQQLDQLNTKCIQLLKNLQYYPLKIQCIQYNKSTTWLQSTIHRKQEINQLIILAVQSKLQKNPLSLKKITQTLPKQNPLIKYFKQLKRQHHDLHGQFVNMLALSNQKMQYFKGQGLKKTRRQQINLNEKKPDLKRINQILQSLNCSRVNFSKQIRDLTKIINHALELSRSIQQYCKSKQNFEKCKSLQQISQARKDIEQFRKKVLSQTQISLNNELIQLYHCEIHNRIRSNFIAGNFQLQKNSKLIKFAQQQKIGNTQTYFKLKQKIQSKNQKSKQINLIRSVQSKLKSQAQKETDPNFKNLYSIRKSMHIPDVEQQTPKLSYIQQLKQKNRELRQKITKVIAQGNHPEIKISLQQARAILLEALKSPFNLNSINIIYQQVERCSSFYNNWKRNESMGKNILYNDQKLRDYEKLKFRVQELQNSIKQVNKVKNCIRVMETIQNIYQDTIQQSKMLQNCILIQENLEQIQQNPLKSEDNQQVYLAKRKYIKVWYMLLKFLKRKYEKYEEQQFESNNKTCQIKVSMKKMRKLLYDSYFLIQTQLKGLSRPDLVQQFKQIIVFLEQLLTQIKFGYMQSNYNKMTNIMNEWIDIDDLVYEIKVGATIEDQFYLYKPYEDLSKFRYRNLNNKNFDIIVKNVKEQNYFKRSRPQQFNIDMKQQKISKRPSHISKQQQSQDEQKNSPNVTQSSRKKIKDILSKNILKNQQLRKYGLCQNQIKMIENQIFGEYHNDMVKYLETSEKFQKLFIKLQQCPQLSKKLIKKEFEFKFIKLLVENLAKISEIQNMMVNKLKQQKNLEKFNNSLQTNSLNILKSQKIEEENNVLDMLATGNVKQTYKQQLMNQMRKLKQAKDKKKKKSKHRRRSRSRSASPQAKFSSQSQQQNLPSYIQKQYNAEAGKSFFQSHLDSIPSFTRNDQPLMFDPQMGESQIVDIEKKYPRGSILKIKQFNLELFLKNKGKLQIKVNLYTLQDYRTISNELFDPGFSSLNIRKQKSDKQILDYLNKPSKKKYKFLISWIEALNQKQNQYLKELSQQASQRHKIFGWQNQLIKVHVMSIRQFVQITRFSSNIPNKTISKQNQQLFDNDRMVCIIQYPADKIYELRQKFKNFSDIQKIDTAFEVSIPLPSYDTYEPIQPESMFNPELLSSNIPTIKPMSFQDPLIKQQKPMQIQGWNAPIANENQNTTFSNIPSNPYQQIRLKMGFGYFSPILTDQEDNINEKQSKLDLADSLLKSIQKKTNIEPPMDPNRLYTNIKYEISTPQDKYNFPSYQAEQRFYLNNPMMGGNINPENLINPMRPPVNNPMNYQQNRQYNNRNQNFNQNNRYQNNQGHFNPNYPNQYQQGNNMRHNNPMQYNMNKNRNNPMFNPNNIPNKPMNYNPYNQGTQPPMGNQYPNYNPNITPPPPSNYNNQNRYMGGYQ